MPFEPAESEKDSRKQKEEGERKSGKKTRPQWFLSSLKVKTSPPDWESEKSATGRKSIGAKNRKS